MAIPIAWPGEQLPSDYEDLAKENYTAILTTSFIKSMMLISILFPLVRHGQKMTTRTH